VVRALAWKVYASAMAVAIGAYYFCPTDGLTPTIWQIAVGWCGAAAVVVGVRLHKPPAATACYLFAAGVFLNSSGIAVETFLARGGQVVPEPSLADVCYLSLYPALVAGMTILIRQRSARREWSSLVDAAIISTGLGLMIWVFVIRPSAGGTRWNSLGELVVAAYPVGDIVVLALIVRLLIGSGGARTFAYRALAAPVLAFLAGDMAWAIAAQLNYVPGPHVNALISMIFLVGFSLFGVAALHPSIRSIAERGEARRTRLSRPMLGALTAASLMAPVILIVEVGRNEVDDGNAIAISSIFLFLLVIFRMAQLLAEVEHQSEILQRLSTIDELTGLQNRRAWSTQLPQAFEIARRAGTSLSIAMLDLDHFKQFNDEYGHQAGDQLLKNGCGAWLQQVRPGDVLARYGGEEFILLLPAADGPAANAVLDRLRAVTPLGRTFSAGVAIWDGREMSHDLVERADRALYQAKHEGRDRTVIAESPGAEPIAEPIAGPIAEPIAEPTTGPAANPIVAQRHPSESEQLRPAAPDPLP
jgi:diguanylate cyclase (GGDEF)-like protein